MTPSALELIASIGVVPVVVLDDAESAPALADALVAGGLPCAEITFRTSAAAAALEQLAGDRRLTVGAGTVLSPVQVDEAVAAGARFIVSPGLDPDVVRRCRDHEVPVIPGVATASDVMGALREGVDVVKLFPAAALGGLQMLGALAAPFPSLRFIPTGGITPAELPGYARHRSVLAVGGSWIAPRGLIGAGRFEEIANLAAESVAAVAAARKVESASA